MANRKTKIIIIVVVVSILVLSAVFLPLTFLVFLAKKPLSTPDMPTLIFTETKISATTNPVEGANSYIFKFTAPNNNLIKIVSSTPTIFIEMYDNQSSQYFGSFEAAGIYTLKCCAMGENETTLSEYSKGVSFERYIEISAPLPVLYILNEQQRIKWNSIANADVYDIYITSATRPTETLTISPISANGIEDWVIEDIMSNFSFPIDLYQISIIARNTFNAYYTESIPSTPLTLTYTPA